MYLLTYVLTYCNDFLVMGGRSASNFTLQDGTLVWDGVVETVPFLNAPGFCNLQTKKTALYDFSVLSTTEGISFWIDAKASQFLHPMGATLSNGRRTSYGIPISYWCPLVEVSRRQVGNDHVGSPTSTVVELYAPWSDFTAQAYGQPVDAPPLSPEELQKTVRVGLTTYLSHETGPFHFVLQAITARHQCGGSLSSTTTTATTSGSLGQQLVSMLHEARVIFGLTHFY